MRVLEDADEHSLIETFAVAAEDLAGALANGTGARGIVIICRKRLDSAPNEIKGLTAR